MNKIQNMQIYKNENKKTKICESKNHKHQKQEVQWGISQDSGKQIRKNIL